MRHNFKKLEIWKSGIEVAKETYTKTRIFPEEERYCISNQLRRYSVSFPSNIAEGTSRKSDRHFVTYLESSLSSAYEWITQLNICFDTGYISQEPFNHLKTKILNIQGKISRFKEKLEKQS